MFRKVSAQLSPAGSKLLQTQVLELATVRGLPPHSNGRPGHPIGPVQVPGLLGSHAQVKDQAGQLQMDPALRLSVGHQGGLTYPQAGSGKW